MPDKASASVQMDEQGRVTIPQSTRRALDVDGQAADLNLDIVVLERHGDE